MTESYSRMIFEGCINRVGLLKSLMTGKVTYMSAKEFMDLLTHAQTHVDQKKKIDPREAISAIEDAGDQLIIKFHVLKRPLYFPKGLDIEQLYMVIAELMSPRCNHYYEIEQTRVEPQDIVLDCGAAEGLFSLLNVDKCKHVYAIEPLPCFVESLKLTFHDIPNVDVVPLALSDSEGDAVLCVSGINSSVSKHGSGNEIKVTTIDALFADRGIAVDYLKADLEGYEHLALKGAERTIREFGPKIAVTTYDYPKHADEISRFLKEVRPDYNILLKGTRLNHLSAHPWMLHAWID